MGWCREQAYSLLHHRSIRETEGMLLLIREIKKSHYQWLKKTVMFWSQDLTSLTLTAQGARSTLCTQSVQPLQCPHFPSRCYAGLQVIIAGTGAVRCTSRTLKIMLNLFSLWQMPALWYRHVITWHDENYSAPAIQRFLIGCYDADWLLKAGYPPYHTWKVIHTIKTQLQQWYWSVHHSIKNRWGLERQNTTNNATDIFWNCDTSTVVFCTCFPFWNEKATYCSLVQ